MYLSKYTGQRSALASAVAIVLSMPAYAAEEGTIKLEDVLVVGNKTYANNVVSEPMIKQQSSLTSVNAVIDNLPGVTVNEGDAYGFDDWSTSITIRGFSTNLGEQQIGTTIDGMPNGGSNYGGGSKANRFLDPSNLAGAEVSQGSADIASRSLEALGGTINFKTDDPLKERRFRTEGTVGRFDGRRIFGRFDTGSMGENDTRAWISLSRQTATDWIEGSANNERNHYAAKLTSDLDKVKLTSYVSYDDTIENNYQRIYNENQYNLLPNSDGLTGTWTGVPVEDQLYRNGWATLRKNLFGYVKADVEITDNFDITASVYHHHMSGRGDWLPPYLVNVSTDNAGESEYLGGSTVRGTPASTGRLYFVDANGNVLTPNAGCSPSYTVNNWYGVPQYTASAVEDPSCYEAGAIAVQSFRNTHYQKNRTGFNLDGNLYFDVAGYENEVRSGVWYEDQKRDESRDWHSVNTRQGFSYNNTPYWVQYDRTYPQKTTKWYVQDTVDFGSFAVNLGAKQFLVDIDRKDNFDPTLNASLNSDSDVLFSGGLVWRTGLEGLEAFFGYAENFKALGDEILERPAADLSSIQPETSENYELGLRYNSRRLQASSVIFQSDFKNRLFFLDNSATGSGVGPNYLIGTNGAWFNAGGIDTKGFELSANYKIDDHFNVYGAYTYTDATYVGTGDAAVDAINGVTPGNRVTGIPKNILVASLNWNKESAFAGISAKYTGDREVNLSNSWTADAYTVTDVYIGYNFANVLGGNVKNFRVNLIVNNLFDENYLGTIAENAAWLGAPRTVSISGALDF